ncbi:MAG: HAMP domain-containing sensor histidine kinase [Verrucomicrobiota bacterium]
MRSQNLPDGNHPSPSSEHSTQSRSVAWSAWSLAMVVLAITVAGGTLHLRVHLREHLAQRDGEILATVALARQYANGSGATLTQRLGNPADQLALALEISQIKEGVLGVRLFDRDGHFETAFPPTLLASNFPVKDLPALQALQPVSRFHERAWLGDYFLLDAEPNLPASRTPLLEVNIPLHMRGNSNLVAAAQLLLDGHATAREYARVDQHLWLLGSGLYLGGALLLSGVLLWAYRRLRKAHALVEERTARLLRANHELALAAKTSALGSVTAHLIHGLSNPLANLQDFITNHGNGATDGDLQALATSTHRMQQLVHDVVRVLGEERGGDQYQITLAELVEVMNGKLGSVVAESGVHLVTVLDAQGELSNRHANLILLVMENLIHNALKVTPRGGKVCVRLIGDGDSVCCEVADEGSGISNQVLLRLFTPCHSTHGGSGLGLAISKQLANQLGAVLELKTNSPDGCVFALRLPRSLLAETELVAMEMN